MNPQDIERLANSVVGSLGRPAHASAGCSGISDPLTFACQGGEYECGLANVTVGSFECGGAGLFECPGWFGCTGQFTCPDSQTFLCQSNYSLPG